jgi:hypothetical protein
VESCINTIVYAVSVYQEAGVRVGMLLGRYLDEPALVGIVATHVADGWVKERRRSAGYPVSNLERWWNAYVELIESTAGGVDCATEDELRRAWTAHARRLFQTSMADPLWAEGRPITPASVGAGR